MNVSTLSIATALACTGAALWFAYRAAAHIRGLPVLKHAAGESLAELPGGVSHVRGLVERDTGLATAPTDVDCLAYRLEIYPDGNIDGTPAKVREGNVPFYVIDGSDALRVDPTEAELVKTTLEETDSDSIQTEIGKTDELDGTFSPGGAYVARYLKSGDSVSIIGTVHENTEESGSSEQTATVDVGPTDHGMYTISDSVTPLLSGVVHRSLLASTAAGSAALLAQTIGLMTLINEAAPYVDWLTRSSISSIAAIAVLLTVGACTSSVWYWRSNTYQQDGVPVHATLMMFAPVTGLAALLFLSGELAPFRTLGSVASAIVVAGGGGIIWYTLHRYTGLFAEITPASDDHS